LATVLALDKDPLHLQLLTFLLKQEGHHVHATADPETALGILQSKVIDLVMLETALPRTDGQKVCNQIRKLNPYTPVMILSERGEEDHVVRGLAAADDYVVKPFSPRSLLARVGALLRRASLGRANGRREENLSLGGITLNFYQRHALIDGKAVYLTPRELSLLYCLMANANRVLSREQLMEQAWGENFVGCRKSVDVCVQRLRAKLGRHIKPREYILALRGFGYKFSAPNAQSQLPDESAEALPVDAAVPATASAESSPVLSVPA